MAKTALELTREEWKAYNPIRSREELVDEARLARAWEVARAAAALLREQYGASRVVAFGSMVHGAWFTARSDIDLMVWGLASDLFFPAARAVDDICEGFEVDLLDADMIFPAIVERVETEGVEL